MSTLFNLPAHNAFVRRHGETVQVRQSLLCPCGVLADAARADPVCPVCGGLGVRYLPPVDMVGMVTSITRERALLEAGVAEPGDAVFSPAPDAPYELSLNDIVLLPWPNDSFQGQLVVRRTGTLIDILHYAPIGVVRECFTVAGAVIVNYTQGSHFTISDRHLVWLGSTRPADGDVFSLSYSAQVEFVVFMRPMERREGGIQLGSRVLLRPRHAIAPVL